VPTRTDAPLGRGPVSPRSGQHEPPA
jgi:hypothetical protein